MAWSITDRFPSWGETGTFPADGFFYEGGDQVNEKHMDALWNGIKGLEDDVQAALNDIDADADGIVDEADYANDADASTYKGNDIDTDGDGRVNAADDATTVKGNDIDTDGDGIVDAADDADTVDGSHASAFASDPHGNEAHSSTFATAETGGARSIYGDGSDGTISKSANETVNGVVRANGFTVQSGVTLNVSEFYIIFSQDTVTINGTIDAKGAGASGGAGDTGSTPGNGGNSGAFPTQSGGSGGNGYFAGSGGDGGTGDTSTYHIPLYFSVDPIAAARELIKSSPPYGGAGGGGGSGGDGGSDTGGSGSNGSFPGGGGGGDSGGTGDGGDGGDGGGVVLIIAPRIEGSGTIIADGQDGQDGNGGGGAGGGGGSGGIIALASPDLATGNLTTSVLGGAGGLGISGSGGDGGDGAAGADGLYIETPL